jgi:hypothetical protein
MLVRIRFGKGPALSAGRRRKQKLAQALAALMTPSALMALALALWRIAAGMKWSGSFAISAGMFSYWETWLGLAMALQGAAWALGRYGKDRAEATV